MEDSHKLEQQAVLAQITADGIRCKQGELDCGDVLTRCETFATNSGYDDLRDQALAVKQGLLDDLADSAIDSMRKVLAEMNDNVSVLQAAREMAKTGKSELFFPRLATTTTQMLDTMTALSKALEQLQQQTSDVDTAADVARAVKGVVETLKTLQDQLA